MKNIFLLSIILLSFSCKAQQTYPLHTDFETVPNYSYLKDTNNELLPFTGIWKATFDNKEIIIKVEKIDHHLVDYITNKFYRDVLFIRYSIKNSQGTVIKSTMNLQGINLELKVVHFFQIRLLHFLIPEGIVNMDGGNQLETIRCNTRKMKIPTRRCDFNKLKLS